MGSQHPYDSQENITDNPYAVIKLKDKKNVKTNDKTKDDIMDKNKNNKKSNTNRYIITAITAILIYVIFAWISNENILEIIDLEIPILIFLSLIIANSSVQNYSKICYPLYIVASCILYTINPTYALFVIIALTSELTIKCIELIINNEYDFNRPKENKYSNRYLSHLLRIRYHLLLSLMLFVLFTLLGYYYPAIFQSLITPTINGMKEGVQQGTVQLETISLFTNNITVASNIILGGIYFSIPTLYLLIFNAVIVGFTGASLDIMYFLSFTLPHGIVELSAIIIAGACGFRFTHAIITLLNGIKIKEKNKMDIFSEHSSIFLKMFLDIIIMVVIITIFLAIAAYIEANLTIPLGKYILSNI